MTDAWRDYRASSNLAAPTILSCGGIGRHSGLKTHGLRSYEFESRHDNLFGLLAQLVEQGTFNPKV